jgi:WhiB family redox-sensing transcriptional regulator
MSPRHFDTALCEELLGRPAWHAQAACRGQGAGEWVKAAGDYTAERAVCASCPVREECLAYALADKDLVGMWGGTTERERREMRRSKVA